jgi:hypothetical protein
MTHTVKQKFDLVLEVQAIERGVQNELQPSRCIVCPIR